MNRRYSVTGLVTGMIHPGNDITDRLTRALENAGRAPLRDGDILVLAESVVAYCRRADYFPGFYYSIIPGL